MTTATTRTAHRIRTGFAADCIIIIEIFEDHAEMRFSRATGVTVITMDVRDAEAMIEAYGWFDA